MSSRPGCELAFLLLVVVPCLLNIAGHVTGREGLRKAGGIAAIPILVVMGVAAVTWFVSRVREAWDQGHKRARLAEALASIRRLDVTMTCHTIFDTQWIIEPAPDNTYRVRRDGTDVTLDAGALLAEMVEQVISTSIGKREAGGDVQRLCE